MKSMQFQFIRTLIPKMKLLQRATVLSIPKFPIPIHISSSSPSVFDICFCDFCLWVYAILHVKLWMLLWVFDDDVVWWDDEEVEEEKWKVRDEEVVVWLDEMRWRWWCCCCFVLSTHFYVFFLNDIIHYVAK
jgi:hypothetical protein